MAGAMSPETSLRNVLPEFEDTRPPSNPFPKNCECRYHIIVTNVNRKAYATHRNYRWRCGDTAGRCLLELRIGRIRLLGTRRDGQSQWNKRKASSMADGV